MVPCNEREIQVNAARVVVDAPVVNGMVNSVTIEGTDLQIVEYKGQRVVTLSQIDKVHGRVDGTAGRTFRAHREQFVEGKHYFEVTADELRRQSIDGVFPPRTSTGMLITEAGYFLTIKTFQDQLAWDVYSRVVDEYFIKKALPVPTTANLDDNELLRSLLLARVEKVIELEQIVVEQEAVIEEQKPLVQLAHDHLHTGKGDGELLDTVLKGMGIHPELGEGALVGKILTQRGVPYVTEISDGRFDTKEVLEFDYQVGKKIRKQKVVVFPEGRRLLTQLKSEGFFFKQAMGFKKNHYKDDARYGDGRGFMSFVVINDKGEPEFRVKEIRHKKQSREILSGDVSIIEMARDGWHEEYPLAWRQPVGGLVAA